MHKFDLKCVAVQQMFINEYEHFKNLHWKKKKNEREDMNFVYGAQSLSLSLSVCMYMYKHCRE